MKESDGGADRSFGPPLGQRPVWDTGGPDHECDCPGPPPGFYLPPPPRPSAAADSECWDTSISSSETCKAVPVIDSEYRHGPAMPSVTIILVAAVAAVVFLFIGTFLVLLKKRKMRNLFPRKSSLRSRCDGASANGAIYEDLVSIRGRTVPAGCPPGQTRLPSIEMIDIASYTDQPAFEAVPMGRTPRAVVADSYGSQELFNPVYEELSNGSGERGESNSEGMVRNAASEDEFAEDELSLGGEGEDRWGRKGKHGDRCLREVGGNDAGRDVDSSDADDRSKFLESSGRNCREKERRTGRPPHGATKRAKTLDKRKVWRTKASPPMGVAPADCSEFNEGFLLRRILQMYPDVTGVTFQYPRGPPDVHLPDGLPQDGADYESPSSGLAKTHPRRPKPDIFSTFGTFVDGSDKNHNQDSAPGSDSGYSNNTSAGRSLPATRPPYGLPNGGNAVLS